MENKINDRDMRLLNSELSTLEQLASPILSTLEKIRQFDSVIAECYKILGISQTNPNQTHNLSLIDRLRQLHGYMALAANPETGPQFQELLTQQILIQRDLLDNILEVLEKRGNKKDIKYDPSLDDFAISSLIPEVVVTESVRTERLLKLNTKLEVQINIDEPAIMQCLNDLRQERERIMQNHIDLMIIALGQQASNTKPPRNKATVFSKVNTAKSSTGEDLTAMKKHKISKPDSNN